MNQLLVAIVASTFVLGSASGFAADAVKKKEELTAEQKTEVRDRVERLKAERAKAEQTKATPAAPGKAEPKEPKRTSKLKTPNGPVSKSAPAVSGASTKKTPA
ncbi:MAG: hypothetical protein ABL891_08495 [Burkholderiales bacterium]